MSPRLAPEKAVGILALDLDGRRLDPRLVAGEEIHDLRLAARALAPAEIHPEEHLRPVLRLRSASTGMDREDRRFRVVGARHHDLQLELVQVSAEAGDPGVDLGM